MFALNFVQTCLGAHALQAARSETTGVSFSSYGKRLNIIDLRRHVIGQDTFSVLAPLLRPSKNDWLSPAATAVQGG